ncbi:Oidioi.mRNA.OKI2018_I69.XSR.g13529.t1.cds [Oikopleura dioica]|uniref:Oidioi.mRNA.OKI2018_I69.XSR.g13529.t1.cds n=1 Tax=Oikopleura dioica TaxID=34765 RepID=A0ABN7S7M5_OIKDI|nr:Oidioi.mRNA.OKI2018_I69.XSR.g13529.t1.cds [Oikopleura dioica]
MNRSLLRLKVLAVSSVGYLSFVHRENSLKQNRVEAKSEGSTNVKFICQKCDEYWRIVNVEQLFEFISAYSELDDAGVQWRLARAFREYALKFPSEAKKLIPLAYEAAARAVELEPNNWAAHKWMGILLSDFAEQQGTRTLLQESLRIKSTLSGAYRFITTLPRLSWYKRKIAAAYYRVAVPQASYEEALSWFERAEENEPMFFDKNHLMLAKIEFSKQT